MRWSIWRSRHLECSWSSPTKYIKGPSETPVHLTLPAYNELASHKQSHMHQHTPQVWNTPMHLTEPVLTCHHTKNAHTTRTTRPEYYRIVATVLPGYFVKLQEQQLATTNLHYPRDPLTSTPTDYGVLPGWAVWRRLSQWCTAPVLLSWHQFLWSDSDDAYIARRTISHHWRPSCRCELSLPDDGGI
jgi:hypothetical protein